MNNTIVAYVAVVALVLPFHENGRNCCMAPPCMSARLFDLPEQPHNAESGFTAPVGNASRNNNTGTGLHFPVPAANMVELYY